MLLTICTTHRPATDLGYLLHKHPDRVQAFELPFGAAHVFYPEASEERCTAALLLDVDPVALVRRRGGGGLLRHYINDRPYVASSLLSVAIAQVFGSALGGRSKERPELAAQALPITATVAALPCRGGEAAVRRLFEPLGYRVDLEDPEADRPSDDWEHGPYRNLTLSGQQTLAALLAHLYVLIPVLDDDKHYYVGEEELEKLLRRGEGWLADHPERQRERVRLLHGALTYRDARLGGYDAAAAVEVIEHLDPERLPAFERVLFEFARPATAVITTPNREYSVNFPGLAEGALRHPDHRFEWTRAEFAAWAERIAGAHGYRVTIEPVGGVDPEHGAPTQMGIFRRCK